MSWAVLTSNSEGVVGLTIRGQTTKLISQVKAEVSVIKEDTEFFITVVVCSMNRERNGDGAGPRRSVSEAQNVLVKCFARV
jgi:hypothetical protein